MFRNLSLRFILPASISTVLIFSALTTLIFTINDHKNALLEQTRAEMLRHAAYYSLNAERMLISDPQLLEDNVSQLATDKRVKTVAVVNPNGIILYANNFSWRGHPAGQVIKDFDQATFIRLKQTREAMIQYNENQHEMLAIMSYNAPAKAGSIRSLEKGIIYIVFDLSKPLENTEIIAIKQRIPELLALLIVTALIIIALDRFVAEPLRNVELAAHNISKGNYDFTLTKNSTQELNGLAESFNTMSQQLRKTITKLDDNSQHLHSIIDNVIDGIITTDREGVIKSFNKSAETIFGHTQDEILSKNINTLLNNSSKSTYQDYVNSHLNKEDDDLVVKRLEVAALRKNGKEFPADIAISIIEDQGEPLLISIIRDITKQKRIEQMKSEFISTVGHELRTPLTSISGALGLLKGGAVGLLPTQAQNMVNMATDNCARLTRLINDLLDMEKIISGKISFDIKMHLLNDLINLAVSSNQDYAQKHNVEICTDIPDNSLVVNVDNLRLTQVLSNLISNAIKFSRSGEQVTISIEQKEDKVRVNISDTGIGIPNEFRPHVFKKFSQADGSDSRQTGGTGLGLAISKELIEYMNGSIGFTSEEGKGSTFYFDLPLAIVPAQQSRQA